MKRSRKVGKMWEDFRREIRLCKSRECVVGGQSAVT